MRGSVTTTLCPAPPPGRTSAATADTSPSCELHGPQDGGFRIRIRTRIRSRSRIRIWIRIRNTCPSSQSLPVVSFWSPPCQPLPSPFFSQLDSEAYSFPTAQQDARGGYAPPGNASWAKGSVNGGPIEGVIPWSEVAKLPYLNYLSLANNKLSGNGLPENIGEFTYLQYL